MDDRLPPTPGRVTSLRTFGIVVVVSAALAQVAVTGSAHYTSGRSSTGRSSLHSLLVQASRVIPQDARYTILWPGKGTKPGRDARYMLYPRPSIRLSARHTLSSSDARSALRGRRVRFVIIFARKTGRPRAASLYQALRQPWSHVVLDSPRGTVYRIDP
jgi:hypothetical protein